MKVKALALLSGGLDSRLAVKVLLDQGIEIEAISFVTVFCNCTSKQSSCLASQDAANKLGIKLKVVNVSQEYLSIVKNPKHGYGSNMNPCIDCRIFMFKKAKEYMKEIDASFLFTGEVVGERPMSQRKHAMEIIEHESGLSGLILRPLSALLMKETIAEKKGLVDRKKLLNISGRSRKPQMDLAKKLAIGDYPCPAGGCLLTDPGFTRRFMDLLDTEEEVSIDDIYLLKVGRHFRLSPELKVIVGRDEKENNKIETLVKDNDVLFHVDDFPGPVVIARGNIDIENKNNNLIDKVAAITARYSQGRNEAQLRVSFSKNSCYDKSVLISPIKDQELDEFRL